VRVEHLKQLIICQNYLLPPVQDLKDQPSTEETENKIQPSPSGLVEQTESIAEDNVQPSSERTVEEAEKKARSLFNQNENNAQCSSEGTANQTENSVLSSARETEIHDWKYFQDMLNSVDFMAMTSNESSAPYADSRDSDVQTVNYGNATSSEEVISFQIIQIWMVCSSITSFV